MSGRSSAPLAVVTGAASGIGKATVERFVDEGFRAAALDRSIEGPDALKGSRVGTLLHGPTGFVLGLVQFQNPPPVERELRNNTVGASSLALQVDDAVSEYERLTSAGVAATSPPTEIVRDGKVAAVAFHVLDPDAIPIEIWQPVDA